ncbi:hypothetical protein [Aromatoleum diolicum]|uniref:Uncharacterized protein n=1 Tax=Aromatoleum diolicum TaxID=75796 RepID=A0ABX1QEL8_9RHOO|nr:hypothetical protein [Aromatoleum diolicum]NMG75841.1 hypothetical protein [Aromatoleum diolicum]
MNRFGLLRVCALASAGLLAAPAFAGTPDDKVLDFDTMAGVAAPYTGATNPIRNVPGGGLPWVLERAQGVLRADGRLEIRVRGLVLADDPLVPPDRRLTNPVPNFRAIVSCQSRDSLGAPSTVNVSTDNFPASTSGDAYIVATVQLPAPCLAPIVFVTNPGGAWFSITGN